MKQMLIALFILSSATSTHAETCADRINYVKKNLRDYFKSPTKIALDGAELALTEINDPKHSDACKQELFETYAFESFSHIYGLYEYSFLSDHIKNSVPMTVARLLKRFHRIKPLSQEHRQNRGGMWLNKEGSKHSLYGEYDCLDTTIYLDPSLHPLDMGSALAHEIAHLIRDQNPKIAEINDSQIFADELLSTLETSFLQSRFYRDHFNPLINSDDAFNDATLFLKDGPVEQISKLTSDYSVPKTSMNFSASIRVRDFNNFLNELFILDEKESPLSEQIYQKVDAAYFQNSQAHVKNATESLKNLITQSSFTLDLNELENRLKTGEASSQCKLWIEQSKSSDFHHYLGVEGSKGGVEGSKGGVEGSKGGRVLRPCIHSIL